MKLSKMTSDAVADVYLKIVPDIKVLMEDEELKKILASRKKPGEGEAEKLGKLAMLETSAYLLKHRRENVWNILAAMNQTTVEDISRQNIIQLSVQILDMLGDKDLIGFFMSLVKLGQQQL